MLGHGAIGQHAIGESKSNPRADRVRQIAESLFGRVHSSGTLEFIEEDRRGIPHDRSVDFVDVEIPADLAGAAAGMLGMGGFTAYITGQDARMAPRRITGMQGQTIVCEDEALTAFYSYRVELQPRAVAVSHDPHAGAKAQTRPT
jgi:hypothetical protein